MNDCDWHILAGNDERIVEHCLTRIPIWELALPILDPPLLLQFIYRHGNLLFPLCVGGWGWSWGGSRCKCIKFHDSWMFVINFGGDLRFNHSCVTLKRSEKKNKNEEPNNNPHVASAEFHIELFLTKNQLSHSDVFHVPFLVFFGCVCWIHGFSD